MQFMFNQVPSNLNYPKTRLRPCPQGVSRNFSKFACKWNICQGILIIREIRVSLGTFAMFCISGFSRARKLLTLQAIIVFNII